MKPGSIVTDGPSSCPAAIADDYLPEPRVVAGAGEPAHALPGVRRVANLLKRRPLGTHPGAVEADRRQADLNEFAFRRNRRRSEFRGLLFRRLLARAVQVEPATHPDGGPLIFIPPWYPTAR